VIHLAPAFPTNIRLGWKGSPGAKSPAYYENYGRKKIIALGPEIFKESIFFKGACIPGISIASYFTVELSLPVLPSFDDIGKLAQLALIQFISEVVFKSGNCRKTRGLASM
jgi:hypothetical protein